MKRHNKHRPRPCADVPPLALSPTGIAAGSGFPMLPLEPQSAPRVRNAHLRIVATADRRDLQSRRCEAGRIAATRTLSATITAICVLIAPTAVAAAAIPVATCAPVVRSPAPPDASHALALTIYRFAGTSWTSTVTQTATREAASLLKQCGIALTQLQECTIEAPTRFHNYATPVSRELLTRITVAKPAVLFVQDTLNDPAYDAEAIGRTNASRRPELADTIWVAFGARDLPQTLAHELVHVLSDDGRHSEQADNLMWEYTSPQSTHITPDQCARLLTHAVPSGLLKATKP